MAAKFEIKKNTKGKFHFNLKAGNGEVILTSETYESKEAAEGGIASVKKNSASDAAFERKTAKDGSPYFVLKAANHEPIGKSEMYKSTASMENGIASVKKNAPDARIQDLSEAK
jgi:uncharacterized protein YegP (UPF0339 family)